MVDRYSGYTWATKLTSLTTSAILSHLRTWFRAAGWPDSIRSDGGPQFRSEFAEFCSRNGIRHELASAHNPRSNGLAEAAVKSIKGLLAKCFETKECFEDAHFSWLITPREDGTSPFTMFYGRKGRSPSLPSIPTAPPPPLVADSGRLHKAVRNLKQHAQHSACLLYTSPSPRDLSTSRMPSSA